MENEYTTKIDRQSLQNIRYVTIKDKKYILVEDVVNLIKSIGDTQETDARRIIHEVANSLTNVAYKKLTFENNEL